MNDKIYKIWFGGKKIEMAYSEICRKLNISAETNFVKITSAGTVSYTLGRPDEITYLYQQVINHGFRPAKSLGERNSEELEQLAVQDPEKYHILKSNPFLNDMEVEAMKKAITNAKYL